jgi:hypothetical protein
MIDNRPTKRWSLLQAAAIGGGLSIAGVVMALTDDQRYASWMWMLEYGDPAETAGRIAGATLAFPLIFVVGAFVRNCWHNLREGGYGRWHSVLRFALFFVLCIAWCLGVAFAVSLSFPVRSIPAHLLSLAAQVLGFFAGGWVLARVMGLLRIRSQLSRVF